MTAAHLVHSAIVAAHLPSPIPQSDFEGAWYYSFIVFAMLVFLVVAAIWVVRAGRSLWRSHQRGPGAMITFVAVSTVVAMVSMLMTAIVALIGTGGTGA